VRLRRRQLQYGSCPPAFTVSLAAGSDTIWGPAGRPFDLNAETAGARELTTSPVISRATSAPSIRTRSISRVSGVVTAIANLPRKALAFFALTGSNVWRRQRHLCPGRVPCEVPAGSLAPTIYRADECRDQRVRRVPSDARHDRVQSGTDPRTQDEFRRSRRSEERHGQPIVRRRKRDPPRRSFERGNALLERRRDVRHLFNRALSCSPERRSILRRRNGKASSVRRAAAERSCSSQLQLETFFRLRRSDYVWPEVLSGQAALQRRTGFARDSPSTFFTPDRRRYIGTSGSRAWTASIRYPLSSLLFCRAGYVSRG
jgi:hypothetical protein